ncbi:myoD family inhibitor [Triplophysa dalaica]|uniref:myoD family inhibitor n=1 Tax=Triplophysa dalaica TaxID=1582913 RepID=UPI0024DFDF70|nr:myoD family inhibitor [Triplophysa dalaica]
MDVQQQDEGRDNTQLTTPENSSHVHTAQPKATGRPQEMTGPASSEMLCAEHNLDHGDSSESLTDAVITNDDALLLPDHIPTISHRIEKEKSKLHNGSPSSVTNGSAVVCTPPSGRTKTRTATPQTCNGHTKSNGHRHRHAKHTPSTSNSQKSFKGDASQIQRVAGDDCCAHCILACLFCEVMSCCSVVAQCLACGLECDALCCCGEAASGGLCVCCGEDTCSALLNCGILEDCCQSSECLEICLECCSICFPT